MRILIAPDKFKGSLTAIEAAQIIERALSTVVPTAQIDVQPVADGGEGTAEILTQATGGRTLTVTVNDPLFRPVEASYGISGDGKIAFIEMAQASGLQHLQPTEYDPLLTSTYGTGELIRDAINEGVTQVILCIGGSATTDGGIGMASALGYAFMGEDGKQLPPVGQSLRDIAYLKRVDLDVPIANIDFRVACDVDNPLFGPNGAAYIYGPQKGATAEVIAELDMGLRRLAGVLKRDFDIDEADLPGSGAAGGLGFGARVFLKAKLMSGFDIVTSALNIEQKIGQADLIITGEGSLDEQTLQGKVVGGITRRALEHGVPVVAFCGRMLLNMRQREQLGLNEVIPITPLEMPIEEAMKQAPVLLQRKVEGWMKQRLANFL